MIKSDSTEWEVNAWVVAGISAGISFLGFGALAAREAGFIAGSTVEHMLLAALFAYASFKAWQVTHKAGALI